MHWYLWDGPRPAVQSSAKRGGYLAARYQNELFDHSDHLSTFRGFGIGEAGVRSRVWLIVEPKEYDSATGRGVYPRGDRNALLLRGGADAGGPLPLRDWGYEFATKMPKQLHDALVAARSGQAGTVTDRKWRDRLKERFGSRWKMPTLRLAVGGPATVDASQPGTRTRKGRNSRGRTPSGGGAAGGTGGSLNTGRRAGKAAARRIHAAADIPDYVKVPADDLERGMLAAWDRAYDPKKYPAGVVLLNIEHCVLIAQVRHWQAKYPDPLADEVQQVVENVYGEIAVAKVAHSEHLRSILPRETIEQMREPAALTMGLLGLMGEEAVIGRRIAGALQIRGNRAAGAA